MCIWYLNYWIARICSNKCLSRPKATAQLDRDMSMIPIKLYNISVRGRYFQFWRFRCCSIGVFFLFLSGMNVVTCACTTRDQQRNLVKLINWLVRSAHPKPIENNHINIYKNASCSNIFIVFENKSQLHIERSVMFWKNDTNHSDSKTDIQTIYLWFCWWLWNIQPYGLPQAWRTCVYPLYKYFLGGIIWSAEKILLMCEMAKTKLIRFVLLRKVKSL